MTKIKGAVCRIGISLLSYAEAPYLRIYPCFNTNNSMIVWYNWLLKYNKVYFTSRLEQLRVEISFSAAHLLAILTDQFSLTTEVHQADLVHPESGVDRKD